VLKKSPAGRMCSLFGPAHSTAAVTTDNILGWINLSTAIVFGLGFATVLTLVVTPAALMGIENMRLWRICTVARVRGLFARRQAVGV
jgi:hypothetical protein